MKELFGAFFIFCLVAACAIICCLLCGLFVIAIIRRDVHDILELCKLTFFQNKKNFLAKKTFTPFLSRKTFTMQDVNIFTRVRKTQRSSLFFHSTRKTFTTQDVDIFTRVRKTQRSSVNEENFRKTTHTKLQPREENKH